MSWSIVSKAAERSSRQSRDAFCDPIALMRWSWMYRRAVSVEWCLQWADWWELSKLLEVWWSMRFDDTFYYFGKERQIQDWPIVGEFLFIQCLFLKQWWDNGFLESGMILARSEGEVDSIGDCGNKYGWTFITDCDLTRYMANTAQHQKSTVMHSFLHDTRNFRPGFKSGLFGGQSSSPVTCGISWARKATVSWAWYASTLSYFKLLLAP